MIVGRWDTSISQYDASRTLCLFFSLILSLSVLCLQIDLTSSRDLVDSTFVKFKGLTCCEDIFNTPAEGKNYICLLLKYARIHVEDEH